jgi:hypothetical protein
VSLHCRCLITVRSVAAPPQQMTLRVPEAIAGARPCRSVARSRRLRRLNVAAGSLSTSMFFGTSAVTSSAAGPTRGNAFVRGLEYYTGPVYEVELTFEIKDDDGRPVRYGSVGGGGRYDGLIGPLPRRGRAGDRVLHRRFAAAGGADPPRQA